jgi:tetratricopeptide (TPR) repeat protein
MLYPLLRFFRVDAARAARLQAAVAISLVMLIAGCAVAPTQSGPSPDELAKQQRLERANTNLAEGLKQYDAGAYNDAMKSFLIALDSGLLLPPQQLAARKHMAFIHCVSSREANCKEEFEKALAIDRNFELAPAESGHPIWGPVFRNVKAEAEARRTGRPISPPPPKALSAGEKLIAEGIAAYDAGDYMKSAKVLQDAIKETLSPEDQIKARKFTAFSFCLSNRMPLCRQEFDRLLQTRPDFDLSAAEAGHPSWGPSFRAAKARAKQPAPPASATPAKK